MPHANDDEGMEDYEGTLLPEVRVVAVAEHSGHASPMNKACFGAQRHKRSSKPNVVLRELSQLPSFRTTVGVGVAPNRSTDEFAGEN